MTFEEIQELVKTDEGVNGPVNGPVKKSLSESLKQLYIVVCENQGRWVMVPHQP